MRVLVATDVAARGVHADGVVSWSSTSIRPPSTRPTCTLGPHRARETGDVVTVCPPAEQRGDLRAAAQRQDQRHAAARHRFVGVRRQAGRPARRPSSSQRRRPPRSSSRPVASRRWQPPWWFGRRSPQRWLRATVAPRANGGNGGGACSADPRQGARSGGGRSGGGRGRGRRWSAHRGPRPNPCLTETFVWSRRS